MKTYSQTLRNPFIFLFTVIYLLFISCNSDDDTSVPLSSEKEVTQFTLTEGTTGTINQDNNTITVTVPFGTDVTSIAPALSISEDATYAPTGAQDFSSPVVYTITAQDGSEIQYTVNVVAASNTEAALLSFIFKAEDNAFEEDIEATIDQENHTVTAEVPFGIDMSALAANITASVGAATNLNELDFSSEATLTVTAQDGETTTDYTVNITEDVNREASLLSFIFKAEDNPFEEDIEATIDQEELTITAQVPFGTDLSALVANINISEGATSNLVELDFSSETTLTVTAQDGETTTDYTVNIIEDDPKIAERAALIAIYDANPESWLNWDIEDPDISNWDGVITDENGFVIELILNSAHLSVIPAEIGQLSNLRVLDVDSNGLTAIPEEIGQLSNLTHLHLDYNEFTSFPLEILQLTNLTELFLNSNHFTSIPAGIGQLTNLTHLYVGGFGSSGEKLTHIPAEIGQLVNLEFLYLSYNEISVLPKEVGQLHKLEKLYLEDNQISSIPAEIGQLTNLTYLNVSKNLLTSIPSEIGQLTNLTRLDLYLNQLNSIPVEIGQLTQLTNLSLHLNQLNTVPAEIGQLTNLTSISIYENQLTSIPSEMGQLINLTSLGLSSNLLTSIPQEVCDLTTNYGIEIYTDEGVSCE